MSQNHDYLYQRRSEVRAPPPGRIFVSGRTKDLLSLAMVVAGVVVLVLTFYRRSNVPELPSIEGTDSTRLEWGEVFAPDVFTFESPAARPQGDGIVALFVLNSEVCPPCLFEVSEYAEVLRETEFEGREIEPLVLVFEREPDRARRFLGTAALPLPGAWGYPEGLAAKLGRYEDRTILQQLLFVDPSTETIFYRTLIPSVVTDLESKRAMVERARSAVPETS